jgi:transposase
MEKSEYRAVIKFLTLEGKPPKEIHERMMNVYRELCPAYSTVKKWAKEYKHGRESLQDNPSSRRPSTSITEENVDAVLQLIKADSRVTIEKIAEVLGTSIRSVFTIIHGELGMNKVCTLWAPKMLRKNEMNERIRVAKELLTLYNSNPKDFEDRLVTCDETWVH